MNDFDYVSKSVHEIPEQSILPIVQRTAQLCEISDDSDLNTIDIQAFSLSNITDLNIPSKLIELTDGWCNKILNLANITISPKNPNTRRNFTTNSNYSSSIHSILFR